MTGLDRPRGRKRKFDIGQVAPADVRVRTKEEHEQQVHGRQVANDVATDVIAQESPDEARSYLTEILERSRRRVQESWNAVAYHEAYTREMEKALASIRSDFPNDSEAPPTQD